MATSRTSCRSDEDICARPQPDQPSTSRPVHHEYDPTISPVAVGSARDDREAPERVRYARIGVEIKCIDYNEAYHIVALPAYIPRAIRRLSPRRHFATPVSTRHERRNHTVPHPRPRAGSYRCTRCGRRAGAARSRSASTPRAASPTSRARTRTSSSTPRRRVAVRAPRFVQPEAHGVFPV